MRTILTAKIRRQMARRGCTDDLLEEAVLRPEAMRNAVNRATVATATAYFLRDGSYLVRDNHSAVVIQISDRNNPSWSLDPSIDTPWRPERKP